MPDFLVDFCWLMDHDWMLDLIHIGGMNLFLGVKNFVEFWYFRFVWLALERLSLVFTGNFSALILSVLRLTIVSLMAFCMNWKYCFCVVRLLAWNCMKASPRKGCHVFDLFFCLFRMRGMRCDCICDGV